MSLHDSPNTQSISADRVGEALAACYADYETTPQQLVIFALCYLRHLSDHAGLEMPKLDRSAQRLYAAELGGDAP